MNKANTAKSTLNNIKSVRAERDCKERSRLRSNRLEMDKREEAEKERLQHTNSIHDENERRRSEDAYKSQEMANAMSRGIRNARDNENRNTADAFMDRNKKLLDKGIDAVKREQSKMYFS